MYNKHNHNDRSHSLIDKLLLQIKFNLIALWHKISNNKNNNNKNAQPKQQQQQK